MRGTVTALFIGATAAAALVGCLTQPTHLDLGGGGDPSVDNGSGGGPTSGSGGSTSSSQPVPVTSDAGLPCEVSFLLVQSAAAATRARRSAAPTRR